MILSESGAAASDGWRYLAAAAVLTDFAPDQLRPLGGLPNNLGEVGEMLMEHGEPIRNGPAKGRWTLSNTSRRAALVELGRQGALGAAIEANRSTQRPDNPTQRAIDALAGGRPPRFEKLSLTELLGMERAIDFLGSAVDVPTDLRPRLLARIERLRLLEPLQRLVSHGFAGRVKEMTQLRAHVDQLASKTFFEVITRGIDRTIDIFRQRPPLVVWGPGGAGKSTLLAKFVLDHAGPDAPRPMPFIHLDFDRGQLDPMQPDSLLTEAFRQIGVQFPDFAQEASRLVVASGVRGAVEDRSDVARSAHHSLSDALRSSFAELIERIGARHGPHVLLFIDTFEVVQRRGSTPVFNVLTLTARLMRSADCLRVVIAGRIPLRETDFPYADSTPRWKPLPLAGFDAEAGRACLAARLLELKAPELPVAELDRVVALVRGNPLSLRLAADVLARLGAPTVEGIVRTIRFDAEFTQERLQGYLHQRIVNALDEPVRRLADPGLVVRRLTPSLILQVLARPCGLAVSSLESAESLFYRLQAEVALVEPATGGAIRHRADVRLLMLPLLRAKLGPLAAEIDREAVDFWAGQDGAVARAEQLYHLAWLDAGVDELEAVWRRETVPAALAEEALDEFTELGLAPAFRIWLCGKLEREISPELEAEANQAQWEQNEEQRARNLLSSGAAEEALQTLRGSPPSGTFKGIQAAFNNRQQVRRARRKAGSNLWALELETLKLLGRDDEALELADQVMALAIEQNAPGQVAAMALHRAGLCERAGRLAQAGVAAARAAEIAAALGDELLDFEGRLCATRVARLGADAASPAASSIASSMAAELAAFSDRPVIRAALARRPALLQEVAAEIGDARPELLVQATRQSGVRSDDPRAEAQRLLGLGAALTAQGDHQGALDTLIAAESIARSLDDHALGLRVLRLIGMGQLQLGHFDSARNAFSQELLMARRHHEPEIAAQTLCILGNIDQSTGDYEAAERGYVEALQLARTLSSTRSTRAVLVHALGNLAHLHQRRGESAQAVALLRENLELARMQEDGRGEMQALGSLAQALMAQEEPVEAATYYREAVQCAIELADRESEASMLCALAGALLHLEDWGEAGTVAGSAVRLARELGIQGLEYRSLCHAAMAFHYSGVPALAEQLANQAVALAERVADRELILESDEIRRLAFAGAPEHPPAALAQESSPGFDVSDLHLDRKQELLELLEATRDASVVRIHQTL